MEISLKELLTTYWSQFTLILAIIGYFIKRIFDTISKKREINHNLFQEKRLIVLNHFFESYAEVEEMWDDISYYDIMYRKLDTKEIDEIIFPSFRKMRKRILELQIYFDEKQVMQFQKIYKNMLAINGTLSREYFDQAKEKNIISKTNNFLEKKEQKLKENELIIKEINSVVKKTFK